MRYLLANGQHLRIREAITDDAVALLDMFRTVVVESDFLMTTASEAERLTVEQERDFISAYQKNDNHLFLIAEVDGEIAGTLSITQAKWQKQQHVGEFGIAILRPYWNLGIARRMMHAMLQWTESHPVLRYLHLSVMANNEKALRIYRNFGFVEEGRRNKSVCQGTDLFADVILMGKWLKPDEG